MQCMLDNTAPLSYLNLSHQHSELLQAEDTERHSRMPGCCRSTERSHDTISTAICLHPFLKNEGNRGSFERTDGDQRAGRLALLNHAFITRNKRKSLTKSSFLIVAHGTYDVPSWFFISPTVHITSMEHPYFTGSQWHSYTCTVMIKNSVSMHKIKWACGAHARRTLGKNWSCISVEGRRDHRATRQGNLEVMTTWPFH